MLLAAGMSLAAYDGDMGEDQRALWRETCVKFRCRARRVPDRQGRAAVALLARNVCVSAVRRPAIHGEMLIECDMVFIFECDWPWLTRQDVFSEPGLPLADRAAFACRFLSDDDLAPRLEELARECVATGNLEGLLLTGWAAPAVNLLGAYVDRCGDVQTASLLVCALAKGSFVRFFFIFILFRN